MYQLIWKVDDLCLYTDVYLIQGHIWQYDKNLQSTQAIYLDDSSLTL